MTHPRSVLYLLLFLSYPAYAHADQQSGLDLFFTGSRASELEPCGCNANQQGGMPFEAALYPHPKTSAELRLDAGGWVGAETTMKPFVAMKTRFLLRGLTHLNMDAVGFGCSEATLSRFYYDQVKKEYPHALALLISANVFLTTSPQTLAFADSRLLTRTLAGGHTARIAVTAATVTSIGLAGRLPSPTPSDFLIKPMLPSLQPVIARLRPQADLLIVLVHGAAGDCLPLARAFPEVDMFIASTPDDPLNPRPLPPEEARRIVAVGASKGRQIGKLHLAPDASGRWTATGPTEPLPVTNKLSPDPELVKLIEEYKQATRQFQEMPPSNINLV